jgi:hypothetical protein
MVKLKTLILKEWAELFRIKMVIYGCVFMPLFMGGVAGYMAWQARSLPMDDPKAAAAQAALLNTSLLYFLILPVVIPVTLGVYSVVGEKEQGTLEPLLATPISDLELFLGKSVVAVIPSLNPNLGSVRPFPYGYLFLIRRTSPADYKPSLASFDLCFISPFVPFCGASSDDHFL